MSILYKVFDANITPGGNFTVKGMAHLIMGITNDLYIALAKYGISISPFITVAHFKKDGTEELI